MATKSKQAEKPIKNSKPSKGSQIATPAEQAMADTNVPDNIVIENLKPEIQVKAEITPKKTAVPKKEITPKKEAAPKKEVTAKKEAAPKKETAAKEVTAKKDAAPAKVTAPKKETKSAAPKKEVVSKKEAAPKKETKPAVKEASTKKEVAPVKEAAPKKDKAPKKGEEAKIASPAVKEKPVKEKTVKAKEEKAAPKKEEVKKSATSKKAENSAAASEEVKPAPVKKKEPALAKPASQPEPIVTVKKPVLKKEIPIKQQIPVKAPPIAPRPMATPASRSVEKKPSIVIAHRRMENKSKVQPEPGNTMIQYLPETYRSILDEPQQQQGPVYRYSDEDLVEFREIITSRLEAARKELNYLQGLITRKDEAGTEDTENRYMNMEDGSGAMEREQLAQLASRQIQFMSHLEKALVRIENKTYGICRVTGKLIDKARLRAVPHATLSIEAKNMMSSKQNQ